MKNNFRKIILSFLFLFFFLFIYLTVCPQKIFIANAASGVIFNYNTTYWGIKFTYKETKSPKKSYTVTTYVDKDCDFADGMGCQLVWDIPDKGYTIGSSDTVAWGTACIDPSQAVWDPDWDVNADGFNIDFTCYAGNNYQSYRGLKSTKKVPVSCAKPDGWGYVAEDGWCPSGNWCMGNGGSYGNKSWCPGAFVQKDTRKSKYYYNAPTSCSGNTRTYCNGTTTDVNTFYSCMTGTCKPSCTAPTATVTTVPACTVASGSSIVVNWTGTGSPTGYKLYACDNTTYSNCTGHYTQMYSGTDTSYTMTTSNGTKYIFYVTVTNSCSSVNSPSVQVTTATPPAPTITAAGSCTVNGDAQITATWTGTGSPSSYTLYYCDNTANSDCTGHYTAINENLSTSATLSHSAGQLTNGHTYKFYVTEATSNCGSKDSTSTGVSLACPWNITAHVFVDYGGGKGFQDKPGDPDYAPGANFSPPSNTFSFSGGVTNKHAPDVNGNLSILNIPYASTETITINPPATNWTVTTNGGLKSVVKNFTANGTVVNFGIKPPAPICTITAALPTVYTQAPNNTTTLTTTVTKPASYIGNIDYTWINGGTVNTGTFSPPNPKNNQSGNSATTIWTAPNNWWTQGTAQPQSTVCITGTGICNLAGCQLGVGASGPPINVIPLYSISGFVYTDINKNTAYNPAPDPANETHFTTTPLKVSICTDTTNGGASTQFCPNDGGNAITTVNGLFDTTYNGSLYSLKPGAYRVTLSLAGLDSSYSPSGNSYSIIVGTTNSAEPSGTCDVNGNVTGVALGMTNSNVWIQTTGGDVYMGSGIQYAKIPQNACGGSYMSIKNDAAGIASPGIIYTGTNSTIDFGAGQASPFQNGTSSPWNWVVGQYPVSPAAAQTIKTPIRITYANRVAALGGDTSKLTVLPNPASYGNYDLSAAGLTHGSYWVNGDLTINNPSLYTFTGGNFEILVSGNLHIRTKIHVDPGSTVLFAAAKNIYVSGNVGEADHTSTTSDLEGFYSAPNFIVSNSVSDTDTSLNRCPASDSRLNMQGAVIGNFEIYRDLCAGDICPTFSIQARPDFTISAPASYLHSSIIQQELSP